MIYASLLPPWQAPDEPAQFERARAALTRADWTSSGDNAPRWHDSLVQSLFMFHAWDFSQAPRQSYDPDAPTDRYFGLYHEIYDGLYGSRLAYIIIGLPLFFFRDEAIALQLYLVRLNTVLMGAGVIILAHMLTKLIFPDDLFLSLGVPLLILFNPQHTHLLATVNNGNLAELLATAALYFVIKGVMKGFDWLTSTLIFILTLGAMWTKATAYFLPFTLGSLALVLAWPYRRYWLRLLPFALAALGLTIYAAPPRLTGLILSGGQVFLAGNFYLDPIVPLDLFRSFWAMPGTAVLRVSPIWYQVLAVSLGLAIIGLLRLLWLHYPHLGSLLRQRQSQALVILAISATAAIVILLAWNAITQSIIYRQGRSIYPVIVPISIFILLGWRQLIPPAWRLPGMISITLVLSLFDLVIMFDYIIPFFYSRYY